MQRLRRITIPAMFVGLALALLYAVFSASSKATNSDPIARYATGSLADLDTSDRGDPVPTATFLDAAGQPVTLETFSGRTILVNFWATWCGPCEREMPALAALHTARAGPDFTVIVISVDALEDRDYAQQRLRELSGGVLDFYTITEDAAGWNIVYDSGAGGGFPTTLIYDAMGKKVAKLEGDADWAGYDAIGLIDAIIAQ